ncbi:MAG: sterol carrier protein domain-containing protein, partial [Candidatus Zixiibacteriota bacterium]
PGDFPGGDSKQNIGFLTKKDLPALEKCYNRICDKTHGMFRRCKYEMIRLAGPKFKIVGYRQGKTVNGFIVFEYKMDKGENMLLHDMNITEMFYENREVLGQLLTWLNTQADQIRYINLGNVDDSFHFIPIDPRDNSEMLVAGINHQVNRQGIGMMYRILDIKSFFRQLKKHNFNKQSCHLKLNIGDSFYKGNAGTYTLKFDKGKATISKENNCDAEISMDIAEFSSMVMGAVTFDKLYEYKLAEISDNAFIKTVSDIFRTPSKPYCVTQF